MVCLPLIERELRVALRKQRPAKSRLKVAAVSAGGSVLFLLLGVLTGSRSLGRTLDQYLCAAALFFILQVPMLISGVLAEERRNQTLGLLFLSGLTPGEVFAGKFLSSTLIAFTNLLALFPMLALPFLIGGISFDVFLATICVLPVLMLLTLSLSLLASVLSRDDGTATVLAVTFAALLCLFTPAIYLAQSFFAPGAKLSLWWLRLSPAYGPYLVWGGLRFGLRGPAQHEFWQNILITLFWSSLAVAGSAFALKRLWQEREDQASLSGWQKRWSEFLHGTRQGRQQLASLWLDVNPFVWLAGRNQRPATLGGLVVGGIIFAWLVCWAMWPARWLRVQNFFITATLLNLVLAWITRLTAAQELGLARRDGAYELLLTTPLNPSDIVWGTLEALKWHFRKLANFVFCLNALMMLAGLLIRSWKISALIEYSLVWGFLLSWSWSLGHRWSRVLPVMWASLNSGRPAHALWKTSGMNTWSWIWVAFNLHNLGSGFRTFPTGSLGEVILVSFFALIGLLVFLGQRAAARGPRMIEAHRDPRRGTWISTRPPVDASPHVFESRLIREFREIVREPLPEPSDPRFKKWNMRERFPWGYELAQQQLHERLVRQQGKVITSTTPPVLSRPKK